MPKERGLAPIVIVLIVAAVAVVGYILYTQGKLKAPILTKEQEKQPAAVNLTTEYKNPFDKKTSYANPFAEYKNPFDNIFKK